MAEQEKESVILAGPERAIGGFVGFLRERGVAGLAIGFIIGGGAQTLVKALIDDVVNPAVGLLLGPVANLSAYGLGAFKIGDFISVLINFTILCFVTYFIFKLLQLERLDKPKA